MAIIPSQVVEKHRDGTRCFQPEVALAVEGTSVLAGVMAVVAHLSHVNVVILKPLPTGVTLVLAFVESFRCLVEDHGPGLLKDLVDLHRDPFQFLHEHPVHLVVLALAHARDGVHGKTFHTGDNVKAERRGNVSLI